MEFVRGSTLLVTLLSATVCAALIFGLTLLSSGTHKTAAATSPAIVGTIGAPAPPQATSTQISDVTIAQRPLFHENRRPYEGSDLLATSFAAEPTNSSHIQLKGVIRRGGTARAYLELIGGGEPVWLKTGESLAGWTLKTVSDDGVMLSDGTREIGIMLHPDVDP